jgi:hypothetical protein
MSGPTIAEIALQRATRAEPVPHRIVRTDDPTRCDVLTLDRAVRLGSVVRRDGSTTKATSWWAFGPDGARIEGFHGSRADAADAVARGLGAHRVAAEHAERTVRAVPDGRGWRLVGPAAQRYRAGKFRTRRDAREWAEGRGLRVAR